MGERAGADPTREIEIAGPGGVAGVGGPPTRRGRLVIRDQVVTRIAQLAAGEVAGTVSSGRPGRGLPKASARVAGDRTRVSLDVGVQWPYPLPAVADLVKRTVATRLSTLTGLAVDAVDVRVSAVLPPADVLAERELL